MRSAAAHNAGVGRAAEPTAFDWLSKQFGGARSTRVLADSARLSGGGPQGRAGPRYGAFTHG